jgi:hypothetical protein
MPVAMVMRLAATRMADCLRVRNLPRQFAAPAEPAPSRLAYEPAEQSASGQFSPRSLLLTNRHCAHLEERSDQGSNQVPVETLPP